MSQSTADRRLIRRVRIRNYRNIAACDVELPRGVRGRQCNSTTGARSMAYLRARLAEQETR